MPDCNHRPPCPGCPRYGEESIAQAAIEKLHTLASSSDAEFSLAPVVPGAASRLRSRLMVRGRANSPKIGLFQAGSHKIVDIPRCPIHHPAINELAAIAKNAIRSTETLPYADAPHRGLLRALQIVVGRQGQGCQVVVVTNSEDPSAAAAFLSAVEREAGARLHSLWWNGQPERSNAIIGPHWAKISGHDALEDAVPGARVFYPPSAFGQATPAAADALIERVHAAVPAGSRVVELYGGVGAVGLGLVGDAAELTINEVGAGSLDGLRMGIDSLPESLRSRVRVAAGPAEHHTGLVEAADVVIVDPPRKGLSAGVRTALASANADRIIYVSCGLDSFLRDVEEIRRAGRFRLRSIEAHGFFPYTDHVETLAVLDK